MQNEQLKIFDKDGKQQGVATRKEVHKKGYWHETFHCWFISSEEGNNHLYFQLRSAAKKDYPGLLDVTAAGHLLVNESIHDGIREVREELGLNLSINDLFSLDVIKDCLVGEEFFDNEFCHVFLYEYQHRFNDFNLQKEEVSGIVKVKVIDFQELWFGNKKDILVEGFEVKESGEHVKIQKLVTKQGFVPHEDSYIERVLDLIKKYIYLK
ncbi:NUDIX hydrolase [Metabacillus bambusae]|uniref:NUDIX domain-containing protein n=1 Tax=Metabacillus bambusae TaxID=2795218 RepID=A0ABS3N2Q1_9BACI|nr:NUDIX domain-containing protein [Metabacillus bambusae]MBO1512557.1 NUDIX domain-containing protein [Metabacillus bambusae]